MWCMQHVGLVKEGIHDSVRVGAQHKENLEVRSGRVLFHFFGCNGFCQLLVCLLPAQH